MHPNNAEKLLLTLIQSLSFAGIYIPECQKNTFHFWKASLLQRISYKVNEVQMSKVNESFHRFS